MGDAERRGSRRDVNPRRCGILSVRIRPGHEVTAIDVSPGGVLLEGRHRLLPGASVELQIRREGRPLEIVRGRVVRCCVAQLEPNTVTYRGAIAFERDLPWCARDRTGEYPVPATEYGIENAAWADVTRPAV